MVKERASRANQIALWGPTQAQRNRSEGYVRPSGSSLFTSETSPQMSGHSLFSVKAQTMNNIHIRDQRLPGHFWADNIAYDVFLRSIRRNERAYAMAVYMAMCRYANNQTAEARVSMTRLVDELGISANTIRKALKALRDHRLIEITRNYDEENRINFVSVYTLLDLHFQIPVDGNAPHGRGTSPHEGGGTSPHEGGVLHHMNPNNTSISRLGTKDSINSENSAVVNTSPEEKPLSTPLTIPHETIPIPTPTPTLTTEEKTIPTLQVEFSTSPEGQILPGISAEPPKVQPKRRAKKAPKTELLLYSNQELFDIILAFSFSDSDSTAVGSTVGSIRKRIAQWIYEKTKGRELTEDELRRFLTKMRGLEGWYKANHKDGYRPKFPNPFMIVVGEYFGNGEQAANSLKEAVTCPTCNGAGGNVQKGSGKVSDTFALCPTCQGRGKVMRD